MSNKKVVVAKFDWKSIRILVVKDILVPILFGLGVGMFLYCLVNG